GAQIVVPEHEASSRCLSRANKDKGFASNENVGNWCRDGAWSGSFQQEFAFGQLDLVFAGYLQFCAGGCPVAECLVSLRPECGARLDVEVESICKRIGRSAQK